MAHAEHAMINVWYVLQSQQIVQAARASTICIMEIHALMSVQLALMKQLKQASIMLSVKLASVSVSLALNLQLTVLHAAPTSIYGTMHA